jgi:uncharacterized protein YggT (Ycf19 family)
MSNVTISAVVSMAISLYSFTILAYVILSWVVRSSQAPAVAQIYEFLGTVCEPYVGLFRRIIPTTGGIDFSPLVALLVLRWLIQPVLVGLLRSMGL